MPSANKQNRFNSEFNDKAARYIRETLCPLVEKITSSVDGIECVIPDDPHVIEVHYPAAFGSTAFMPEVKLEIGPLASWVPKGNHIVRPYAAEDLPQVFDDPDCPVVAITAERTFWEKATILHQQAHRTKDKPMPSRYSRHYYDLYQMTRSNVAANAIADPSLLDDVVKFKQRFYRSPWASYETAKPGSFRLMPSDKGDAVLRKDYTAMRPMFFSDPPPWDDILDGLRTLEQQINSAAKGQTAVPPNPKGVVDSDGVR